MMVAIAPGTVAAAVLTNDLEVHLIQNVSTAWKTVPLGNSYSNAIPICSYNLISFAGANPNYAYPPAAVRIRNITSNSFELRIQGWEDSAAETGDVHCLISDEGAFTLPDGTRYEAHTVVSDRTSGSVSTDGGWNQANLENVSASIVQTYTDHVVLGQVISYNDSRASVFHVTDCESRVNEAFQAGHADGICVGKHIGQIASSRNPETIGYLVAEAGSGSVNGIDFELDSGADSVAGNSAANIGYTYNLSADYTVGVTSQAGEDGGNGSWSVLYGADPLPPNQIVLAVDEEVVQGDTTRNHTTERVDYWVFRTAELTLNKVVVNDDGGTAVVSDFTIAASGPDVISGISGDAFITDATVAAGDYVLSEQQLPGYAGTWSCAGATLAGTTLTIDVGDEAVCTVVNDDKGIDLDIQKSVSNPSPNVGDVVTFTIEVINNGPDVATDVQIIDVVKPGFIYVAGSITGGSIRVDSAPAGSGLDWTIASIAIGASEILTFQATVSPP